MKTFIMKKHFTALCCILWVTLPTLNIASAQGTWTQKADYPEVRTRGMSGENFSIGTKGYFRSYSDIDSPLTDFWEWDQTTNVWTKKVDCPTKSSVSVGFSIGEKGYIGFGYNETTKSYTNEFWEYDPVANSWIQKTSLPTTRPRTWNIYFSIGTKGYIGIGTEWVQGGTVLNYDQEFWEWDQETDIWTRKADFEGLPRLGAVCFSIGKKGYIGTGNTGAYSLIKDFWEWDQETNVWTQKADFGGLPRVGAAGFSIGNKGYIGTGIGDSIPVNYYSDLWEWEPATNIWTQKADFEGGARYVATGFSIGNKGYIGNGNNEFELYNDFWEFDPSAITVIDEIAKENNFFYPNPVMDKFTFKSDAILGKAQLTIINVNGQKVMQQIVPESKTEIDVSKLQSGLYFLKLVNGKTVETGKIIKE